MKRLVIFTATLLASFATSLAQTPTYAAFPPNQDVQNVYGSQVPGCTCGMAQNNPSPHLRGIQVDPTSIQTTVGQDVQIRYDASAICQGQTIRDRNGIEFGHGNGPLGTAEWQVGTIQNLPDTYGIITLPGGFAQAKTYTVTINLSVQCYDSGADCHVPQKFNTCGLTVSIPVTVSDSKKNKAQLRPHPDSSQPSNQK